MSEKPIVSEKDGAERLLLDFLHLQDASCPRCGYNLRRLTGTRCPECGDELRLQVGLVEPRLGAYISLLVACCLGLGGSGLIWLIMIFNEHVLRIFAGIWEMLTDWVERLIAGGTGNSRGFRRNESFWMFLLGVELVVTGASLAWLLARRTRFRKWRIGTQRTLSGLMWLFVVGMGIGVMTSRNGEDRREPDRRRPRSAPRLSRHARHPVSAVRIQPAFAERHAMPGVR
jgi:hypothetical protein